MIHKYMGFSLMELMIVLAVIGILALVAYPSYVDQITKSRRVDATSTLLSIVSAEERYRSNNLTFGTLSQVWSGVTTTPRGYYTLALSAITATGYVLTATATTSGGQANDDEAGVNCGTLTVNVSGLSTTRTPAVCW